MVFNSSMTTTPRERGERGERWAQAEVPGSSDPSEQSQKSSLRREMGNCIDGDEIQLKVSEDL